MDNIKEMTLEEFNAYVIKNDKNVVRHWNYSQFALTCVVCGSDKCYAINDLTFREGTGGGCSTCGWGADTGEVEGYLVIKCSNCGNAMTILTGKEIEDK